ncbi:phage protein [Streptococcus pyogenes]|nr:phage protein [Streptococcus pyogenes]
MIKHIQEEAKKTWYQRLGDSIQDQWWNFKGWLRG